MRDREKCVDNALQTHFRACLRLPAVGRACRQMGNARGTGYAMNETTGRCGAGQTRMSAPPRKRLGAALFAPVLPLLLLLPLLPFAHPSTPLRAGERGSPESGEAALAKRIEAVINRGDAAKAFWGIEVFAPARGRTIYSLNAHRYFLPASVAKLFTTAAAMDLLGPDYQFRTVVGARARIDRNGRLLGNLYLVGGGDPDLAGCALPYTPEEKEEGCDATRALDQLAEQVAANGVRVVTGDLIVDQSFFAPEPYAPGWAVGDLLWGYGAPVRALSLADNVLTVTVEPGEQANDRGRLAWEPFTRFYDVQNQTWTAPAGAETQLYVRRDPGSRVLEVSGPIALDQKPRRLRVAIEEPGEVIGELFRQALERHGVRLLGGMAQRFAPAPPFTAEPGAGLPVVLAEHVSRPLIEDVTLINKVSVNLHAEMLLRVLGRQEPPPAPIGERPRTPLEPPRRHADGSAQAGLGVLRAWLANAGVNPNDVDIEDGSGLSRSNLVTPHAVVQLLKYADQQSWRPLFVESLAVAGVDGTLEERMKEGPARGRVRAKTGSLGDTTTLAGYVQTTSGETLVFALFLNHRALEGKQAAALVDELCAALAELPPTKAKTEKRK